MATDKQLTVYVIQRLSWEYGDDFYYRSESEDAPMESFLDRSKAEARRRQLEWVYVRDKQINPFGWIDASLEERSSLPRPQLLERLRQAGLHSEETDDGARMDFWQQYDEQLSDEQRQLVWEALDQMRFFQLVEMTVELDA
jgi:hypothetical protein